MPKLAIFEDDVVGHLKPLTHTRAAFDLRAGIFSFKEKIERMLNQEADYLICREEVAGVASETHPTCSINPDAFDESTFFVNGRWIPDDDRVLDVLRTALSGANNYKETAWTADGVVVGAFGRLDAEERRDLGKTRLVSRLWQLVNDPGAQITLDAELFTGDQQPPAPWPDLTMVHEERIWIHSSAEFGAGVILNASRGPIVIESEAVVADGAIVIGPCHVAQKARLKPATRVSRSSIGYNSRVGGEISSSLVHANTNKAHDGYLGNSYIGEWCNIGADSNTSNLRNDYGFVTLYNEQTGGQEPTGEQFVGLVMGDHSACGINTMFNTASVVGVCCNVFGAGFQSRYVKSFSWGSRERMMSNGVDKALKAATAVMARRERAMSDAHKALLEELSKTSR
jgi:UDP-N-acetylglucosamine diphosphorylase/glucosamine-1-phosphate N-acetyltransferase